MEIRCVGCGEVFESDNEDDEVERVCPDCKEPSGMDGGEQWYVTDGNDGDW